MWDRCSKNLDTGGAMELWSFQILPVILFPPRQTLPQKRMVSSVIRMQYKACFEYNLFKFMEVRMEKLNTTQGMEH